MSLLQRFLRRVLELDSRKDPDMLQWIYTGICWRKEELKFECFFFFFFFSEQLLEKLHLERGWTVTHTNRQKERMFQTLLWGYGWSKVRITRCNLSTYTNTVTSYKKAWLCCRPRQSSGCSLPDLNERSSCLVSPQLTACRGGGKTLLRWVILGGRWPEADPLSHLWPGGERQGKREHRF